MSHIQDLQKQMKIAGLERDTEKKVKAIFKASKDITYDSKLDLYHDMLGSEKKIRILGNSVGVIIAILAARLPSRQLLASIHSLNHTLFYEIKLVL